MKLKLVLLAFTFFACIFLEAKHIPKDEIDYFTDTTGISFEQLLVLPNKEELFQPFESFDKTYDTYWMRIQAKNLLGHHHILLPNYFDYVEAYYEGDPAAYSRTGRLVEFEDRSYGKGFYRLVVNIDAEGGDLYIKLTSTNGYSRLFRSFSGIEAITSSQLAHARESINNGVSTWIGMGIVIILINIILLFSKHHPEHASYSYLLLILLNVPIINLNIQNLFIIVNCPVVVIHYMEMIVGSLSLYANALFAAFFLKIKKYSKPLFIVLVFPFFPILWFNAIFQNADRFAPLSTMYFLLTSGIILFSVIWLWGKERKNIRKYIVANSVTYAASIVRTLAFYGVLPINFMTSNTASLSLILRDVLFTSIWVNDYFKMQKEFAQSKMRLESLHQEKEQIKQLQELKNHFFNNVSHDLKTPLMLVLSPLENILKQENLSEGLKKELQLSLRNGKYLHQLVNEMLDLVKFDKGELDIQRQPVEIVSMLYSTIESFASYAKEQGQKIKIITEEQDLIANIDKEKFEKVITNLISNAIKYSKEKGEVVLSVKRRADDLILEVKDRGIGIEQPDLPYIFDRYFMSADHQREGTGIGLAIVKEFTELHGGTVLCESEKNQGTVFTLIFPHTVDEAQKPLGTESQYSDADRRYIKLLLVEDNEDMRSYLANALSGFEVVPAKNGADAWDQIKRGTYPDLIITDYAMPDMNGYELAQKVKQDDALQHIPIIFITARSQRSDKLKILNLGVDDYITKPFDMNELKARISNTLKTKKERLNFHKYAAEEIDLDKEKSFKKSLDDYLLSNLHNKELSNVDLKDFFATSDRSLYRRIKESTGKTPAAYIREIRLQKARILLESETKLTISEIAYSCGIDNVSHFSQAFKKRFGKSPTAYLAPKEELTVSA